MGTLHGTVAMHDGKPHFRHDDGGGYSEPVAIVAFWRMPDGASRFEGRTAIWSNTGGKHYSVFGDRGEKLTEYHAGDGPPDHTERREIPPPKTRLETRYLRGRWERKYAKGWR